MISHWSKLKQFGVLDPKVFIFVAGSLLIPAVFGRIIGDALRVYVALYVYLAAWVILLCAYWIFVRRAAKVKRSTVLVAIIVGLAVGLPIWILSTWDRERLIYHAARYEHPIIFRLLLARGTNQDEINKALLHGTEGGATRIVEYALAKGASPNAKMDNGDSALMVAAQARSTAIAQLLLRHGADANARNNTGRTPLIWVAHENAPEIAQLLIGSGADVNARDYNGETALGVANRFQNKELIRLLKQSSAVE